MKRNALLATATVLALCTAQWASASTITYDETWTCQGLDSRGIEVDGSGNVYVVDFSGKYVEKHDSTGAFLSKFQTGSSTEPMASPSDVAISSANGDLFVCTATSSAKYAYRFDSAGSYLGRWTQSSGVSLTTQWGPDGYVYVTGQSGTITKHDSAGTLIQQWNPPSDWTGTHYVSGTGFSPDGQYAYTVDNLATNGNLYRITLSDNTWTLLATTSNVLTSSKRSTLAVHPTTGDVYVTERGSNQVEVFNSAGTLLHKWNSWNSTTGEVGMDLSGGTAFGTIYGMALDPNLDRVYVTDQTGLVTVFNETADVPEPSTLALAMAGMVSLLAYAWRKRK